MAAAWNHKQSTHAPNAHWNINTWLNRAAAARRALACWLTPLDRFRYAPDTLE